MAREESDRENLLRDATALARRLEMRITSPEWLGLSLGDEVFVGFRPGGAISAYLSQDLAYHFTSSDRLRRAYAWGVLYRAQSRHLEVLRRERSGTEVTLLARRLNEREQQEFLHSASQRLSQLHRIVQAGEFQRVGQFPEGADLVEDVLAWLERISARPVEVAESPRVD